MRAKLIYVENGKITFTKKELEDLLKATYDEGYQDGLNYNKNTYPFIEIKDGNKSNSGPSVSPNPWASPFVYNGDVIKGSTSTTATLTIDNTGNVSFFDNDKAITNTISAADCATGVLTTSEGVYTAKKTN